MRGRLLGPEDAEVLRRVVRVGVLRLPPFAALLPRHAPVLGGRLRRRARRVWADDRRAVERYSRRAGLDSSHLAFRFRRSRVVRSVVALGPRGKTRRRALDAKRGVVVVVVAILEKHVARRGTAAVLRFFLTDDYVVQSCEHVCRRRLHPSFTQSLQGSVKD